ncbi:MAG: P1 family peptidase [Terriglobia bacterium]
MSEGNVGAGSGATVGKLFGLSRAMKGGLGTSSIRIQSVVVAALVVVNAFGDVIDKDTGRILAGARSSDGEHMANTMSQLLKGNPAGMKSFSTNTTIGVVATNLALSKVQANKVAQMAQDGLARSINPVHTPYDGDTLFVVGTGEETEPVNLMWLGSLAAEVVAQAVQRAMMRSESLPGLPSARDFASPRKPAP